MGAGRKAWSHPARLSRVECLVPAQGARNKALDEVSAAFHATRLRGTVQITGANEAQRNLHPS